MRWLVVLLLIVSLESARAQTPVAAADAILRAGGCAVDDPVVASLPPGTTLKLRFALSGESIPCYKVIADLDGKPIEGYLPVSAMRGLDSFDKARRDAAWITATEVLSAVRSAQPAADLKAPAGASAPLPASARVVLAQAEQFIESGQPAKALAMLEPEIKKRRDPYLLSTAGVAAWRADDARQALDYWRESLDILPNPALERLYQQVEQERTSDRSGEKLVGNKVVLRYDAAAVPIETARAMVAFVDSAYARVSSQLGCTAEEKIVTVVQTRDAYQKSTGAAEWSGGQFDGRIRVPMMNGQQMNAAAAQVLAHETTHACLAMLGEWPSWLHEGMAQKLSGAVLAPQMRAKISALAQDGKLPKLADLRQGWSRLDAEHATLAYAIALAAVDALYENIGSDGVRNLLRNPERLPALSADLDRHRLGL
jgi:hypothetical protein